MNSDGSDIRFTSLDNSQKYDYWIEDWKDGGTSKIWVEVPLVPAGTSNMYLWSNSPEASSESNDAATFECFDDFPGTSREGTKWRSTAIKGTPVVSGGTAQLNDDDAIKSPVTFNSPYAVKAISKSDSYDSAFLETYD